MNSTPFTVKLSGLDWNLTQEDIHGFLVCCDVVGGPAGIIIETNAQGKPSSAFVNLKTKTDLENALKYNKKILGKRYVDIEEVQSNEKEVRGENKQRRSTTPKPSKFSVELSGLDWSLTNLQIHDFLVGCEIVGGPAGVTIGKNDKGKPSGSALVLLNSKADVEKAMKYNKNTLGKRYVDIKELTIKNEEMREENIKDRTFLPKPNMYNVNTSMGADSRREKSKDIPEPINPESFIVKLSGLDWALTQEQIHGFLVGCEIVQGQAGVTIEMNDRGKPSGSAFVQLKTRKDVDMAMKYNKNTLGKRYVDIEDVTRKHGEAKDENTKSRSTLFTHQKEGPKEGKFYVKMSNVSRKVTAANITDFFSSDNNLRISEIFLTLNDKGKPSGDAFVKLDSKEDLVVALEFNGRAMGNRQIEVCQVNMDEYEEAKKQQKLGH